MWVSKRKPHQRNVTCRKTLAQVDRFVFVDLQSVVKYNTSNHNGPLPTTSQLLLMHIKRRFWTNTGLINCLIYCGWPKLSHLLLKTHQPYEKVANSDWLGFETNPNASIHNTTKLNQSIWTSVYWATICQDVFDSFLRLDFNWETNIWSYTHDYSTGCHMHMDTCKFKNNRILLIFNWQSSIWLIQRAT